LASVSRWTRIVISGILRTAFVPPRPPHSGLGVEMSRRAIASRRYRRLTERWSTDASRAARSGAQL
jgi:hypothetical protein